MVERQHRGAVEPRRAETDVDPVAADLDPFDQGSEHNTLACHRQFGPALAEICGTRGQPLRHASYRISPTLTPRAALAQLAKIQTSRGGGNVIGGGGKIWSQGRGR